MRQEVEVKLKIEDPKKAEKAILSAGGVLVREVEEIDVYFDHPCKNFAVTDEALRVRKAAGKVEITYKGARLLGGGVKRRPEITVETNSYAEAIELLGALGFRRIAEVRKNRKYYTLEDAIVTVDTVEKLGDFVEIEDPKGREEKLREIAEKIGVSWRPITGTYLELLLETEKE